MRKIVLPVLLSSAVVLFSCNDESNTDNNNNNADTSATTENNNAATNNVLTKTITLSPSEEVPPNNTSGTGTANVTYNKDNKMLTYTLSWSGLTGEATMAHIHGTAAKGANAGPRRDLTGMLQKSASGSLTDSVMVDGNEIKEDSLLQGFYYFNIHTKANPGGEIRGQITF
jgi:hypothetical protein